MSITINTISISDLARTAKHISWEYNTPSEQEYKEMIRTGVFTYENVGILVGAYNANRMRNVFLFEKAASWKAIQDAIDNGTCLVDSDTGEVIDSNDYSITHDGRIISDETADSDYFTCENCGELFPIDEAETVDGNEWCRECTDNNSWYCDGCDERHSTDTDAYTTRGGWSTYCEWSYQDAGYCYCPDCGYLVRENEWNDDADTCIYCSPKKKFIKGYHDRPEINFYGKRNKKKASVPMDRYGRCTAYEHIGFELEVDGGSDAEGAAEYLNSVFGDLFYYNRDGSLTMGNGFEIISQPMTFKYMYDEFLTRIDEPFKKLSGKWNYKSHNTDTCGLHFHISREYFSTDTYKRRLALRKMVIFYEDFYDDVIKVSRRKDSKARHWAAPYNMSAEEIERSFRFSEGLDGDRYHCVNLTNDKTVEIRIMRGTLNPDTFRACTDFVMTIARNSRRIKVKDRYNLTEWFKGMKPETIEYIKSRDAFPAYTATV